MSWHLPKGPQATQYKILIRFFLPDGASQDEIFVEWKPINFFIPTDFDYTIIEEAVADWLDDNTMKNFTQYDVIYRYVSQIGAGRLEKIYQDSEYMG